MATQVTTTAASGQYQTLITDANADSAAVIRASTSNTGNVYIRRPDTHRNYPDAYPLAAGESFIVDYSMIVGGLEANSDNGTEEVHIFG